MSFKQKFLTVFSIILSAIGVQYIRPATIEEVKSPIVLPEKIPVPSKQNQIEINVGSISGTIGSENEMIKTGIGYANVILPTECVKHKIITAAFTETNGLTNGQIYNLISSQAIKINIKMFYGNFRENYIYKTIGREIGDGVVYMNRFYVKDSKTVMSLVAHEVMHQLGFHHYNKNNKSTSIPYQMNDFIESCYKELQ